MLLVIYALLGAGCGVLVNRAADNLPPPARRSLFAAPHCAYCGAPRAAREQIGVAAFLALRSRCHSCNSPLPLRAPLVEITLALLFGFLWTRFELGLGLAAYSLFTTLLVLIVVIDVEHRLILNVVVLPATALALLLSPIMMAAQGARADTPLHLLFLRALLGAGFAYVVVLGIYFLGAFFAKLLARARGRALNEVAFGMGDVKLAGLVGALIGFPAIFFALIYTILFGGIGALLALGYQGLVRRQYSAFMAIPYGPYFCITAWLFMLWGRDIVRGFLG